MVMPSSSPIILQMRSPTLYGVVQHARGVAHGVFGLQLAERDDAGHVVLAVHLADVLDDLLAALILEVACRYRASPRAQATGSARTAGRWTAGRASVMSIAYATMEPAADPRPGPTPMPWLRAHSRYSCTMRKYAGKPCWMMTLISYSARSAASWRHRVAVALASGPPRRACGTSSPRSRPRVRGSAAGSSRARAPRCTSRRASTVSSHASGKSRSASRISSSVFM